MPEQPPLLPDVNEFQDHIRSLVAYSLVNHRSQLLQLLKKNGVILPLSATDKMVLTAVYVGVAKSKVFRADLRGFITNKTTGELGMVENDPIKNNLFFINSKNSFNNFIQNPAPHGWDGEDFEGDLDIPIKTIPATKKNTDFKDTSAGNFLNNLFNKDNINKAVGIGLDMLGKKMSSKATQQELDKATQLEVAKTQALIEQQKKTTARNKWLVPIVIISSIGIIAIVAAVIYKKQ